MAEIEAMVLAANEEAYFLGREHERRTQVSTIARIAPTAGLLRSGEQFPGQLAYLPQQTVALAPAAPTQNTVAPSGARVEPLQTPMISGDVRRRADDMELKDELSVGEEDSRQHGKEAEEDSHQYGEAEDEPPAKRTRRGKRGTADLRKAFYQDRCVTCERKGHQWHACRIICAHHERLEQKRLVHSGQQCDLVPGLYKKEGRPQFQTRAELERKIAATEARTAAAEAKARAEGRAEGKAAADAREEMYRQGA